MREIHNFGGTIDGIIGMENSAFISVYGNLSPRSLWSFFKIDYDGILLYTHIEDSKIDSDMDTSDINKYGILKIIGVDVL